MMMTTSAVAGIPRAPRRSSEAHWLPSRSCPLHQPHPQHLRVHRRRPRRPSSEVLYPYRHYRLVAVQICVSGAPSPAQILPGHRPRLQLRAAGHLPVLGIPQARHNPRVSSIPQARAEPAPIRRTSWTSWRGRSISTRKLTAIDVQSRTS